MLLRSVLRNAPLTQGRVDGAQLRDLSLQAPIVSQIGLERLRGLAVKLAIDVGTERLVVVMSHCAGPIAGSVCSRSTEAGSCSSCRSVARPRARRLITVPTRTSS